jgi:carboxypeptidase C (cathepsin A)
MNIFQFCLTLSLIFSGYLSAQEEAVQEQPAIIEKVLAENASITAQGQKLVYDVHGGSITLKGKDPNETAAIHFIAYFVKSPLQKMSRPIAFCFNGGPGSSSVWLHMGFLGPKIISTPLPQIPGVSCYHDNPVSLLSVCDLVFIDPVATGFSKASDEKSERNFFGVEEDIRSAADFVQLFLTKFQRWQSPKLIIGESYGTARAVGLAHLLQNEYFLNIDGLILISLALDFPTPEQNPTNDLSNMLHLPTFAVIAQYHKKLGKHYSEMSVKELAEAASAFSATEYGPALFSGSQLPAKTKESIAQRLAEFTSLPSAFFISHNLRCGPFQFRKKLFKETSSVVGRFDGRMMTWDPLSSSGHEGIDPSFFFVTSPFTCAINDYLAKDLKWNKQEPYLILNCDALRFWNWHSTSRCGFRDTSFLQDLRMSLAKNPNLKVFVAAGYYDLATPFFAQQYTLNHLFVPERQSKNISFKVYETGHMIYLDEKPRKELSADLSQFVKLLSE